jgi:hypothetical protein
MKEQPSRNKKMIALLTDDSVPETWNTLVLAIELLVKFCQSKTVQTQDSLSLRKHQFLSVDPERMMESVKKSRRKQICEA